MKKAISIICLIIAILFATVVANATRTITITTGNKTTTFTTDDSDDEIFYKLWLESYKMLCKTTFPDIKATDWFGSPLNEMASKGQLYGCTDGTFKPNDKACFNDIVRMVEHTVSPEKIYEWTDQGTKSLSEHEMGIKLNLFKETDFLDKEGFHIIQRKEVAYMISNMLGEKLEDNYDNYIKTVSDVDAGDEYSKEIMHVYSKGIMTCAPDRTFRPDCYISRAELAMIIYRYMNEDKRVIPDTTIKNVKKYYNYTVHEYQGDKVYKAMDISIPYKGIAKIQNNVKFFSNSKDSATFIAVYATKPISVRVYANGYSLNTTSEYSTTYYKKGNYYVYLFNRSDDSRYKSIAGKQLAITYSETSTDWWKAEIGKIYVINNVKF